MSEGDPPSTGDLQFERAEPLPASEDQNVRRCVVCQQAIEATYYHAQGQVVCPSCAAKIEAEQQAPPAVSLMRAFLYGGAAALGGCILYATVAIATGLEIGLISIVVGIMVGKSIRYASGGLGGRPQQILAVTLTYFAITTSYIPVAIHQWSKSPEASEKASQSDSTKAGEVSQPQNTASPAAVILFLLALALAAPFFGLNGISGLISLAIIFFGLHQAWKLTGRTEVLVTGPYDATPAEG